MFLHCTILGTLRLRLGQTKSVTNQLYNMTCMQIQCPHNSSRQWLLSINSLQVGVNCDDDLKERWATREKQSS